MHHINMNIHATLTHFAIMTTYYRMHGLEYIYKGVIYIYNLCDIDRYIIIYKHIRLNLVLNDISRLWTSMENNLQQCYNMPKIFAP